MDFQVVLDELREVIVDILNALPDIINGLILLLVGYLFASAVRFVLRFVLPRLGFDALMEQIGIADGLRRIGIRTPLSRLMAQVIFVILLLSFTVTATRLMGLHAIATVLEQILVYLPNAVAALIVFLIGGTGAAYAGELVGNSAAGGGLSYARTLGQIVQILIMLFVIVLALGALGVDTSVLVTVLTIMMAAFGLALSLALGLGAQRLVLNILAGHYVREQLAVGQQIDHDGVRGAVSEIGSVYTVLTTADGRLLIPHRLLVEGPVRAGGRPPMEQRPSQTSEPPR